MSQTTASIRYITDKDENVYYPVTHERGVVDSNGTTLETKLGQKQATLVSGTNIKTINNESILGSGNITVSTESIDTVSVSVDNNTGVPSATGSFSEGTLSLGFTNLKGAKGDTGQTGATGPQGIQGPRGLQGNTGSSLDYPFELVNNDTDGGTEKAWTAERGKAIREDLGNIEMDLSGRDDTTLNLSNYEALIGHLGTSSAWGSSVNSRHIYIPCREGDKFELTGNETLETHYAFMPEDSEWESEGSVTTIGGRLDLAAEDTVTAICPTDGHFLYIQTRTSGKDDNPPSSVVLKAKEGLVEKVSRMQGDVDLINDQSLDASSFVALKGHLANGSAWATSVNSRHIYIPCTEGDIFDITANSSTGTNYAWMPTDAEWSSGGSVTTIGGRVALAAGKTAKITCPANGNYLYLQTKTSNQSDSTPSDILKYGIRSQLNTLNKQINGNSSSTDSFLFDDQVLNIQYSVLVNKTGYAGNSMGHFMYGIRKGFNALKADMRLTSDGEIILCHDAGYTLDSNGKITGYNASSANTTPIHEMTLAQCKALEFASPDTSGNYYNPVELSEFIYVCKYYGIIPFITLREDNYRQETSEKMAYILQKYGMEQRAIINLYMSPANLSATTEILDITAPRVKRCYTMLEGWSMSIANLTHGLNCGCQYICTFSSHQGDITDELCVFMANNNARLLSIIYSEEEYNSTTENGYVGFQSYADYAPVRTPASISLELAESV